MKTKREREADADWRYGRSFYVTVFNSLPPSTTSSTCNSSIILPHVLSSHSVLGRAHSKIPLTHSFHASRACFSLTPVHRRAPSRTQCANSTIKNSVRQEHINNGYLQGSWVYALICSPASTSLKPHTHTHTHTHTHDSASVIPRVGHNTSLCHVM